MISLKEALISKNREVGNIDQMKEDEILNFIKDNYIITVGSYRQITHDHLEKYISFHDDIIDIIGGANIELNVFYNAGTKKLTHLTNGLFKFGKIDGDFECAHGKELLSLQGAPEFVGGDFDCSNCENLTTLEGAPKQCSKFLCNHCTKLTSLKGISKKIDYAIECNNCKNLKSIDDIPSNFDGRLYITSEYDFDLSKFMRKCDIYTKTKIIEKSGKVFVPKKIKNGTVYGWKELKSNTAPPFSR